MYDSGIEEECSESLRRSPEQSGFETEGRPPENISDGTRNSRKKVLGENSGMNETSVQGDEPLYQVLEGPADGCSGNSERETGIEDERAKSASFYQSLRRNHQNSTNDGNLITNVDTEDSSPDEMTSSSAGVYEPLSPPKQVNKSSEIGSNKVIDNEKEAAGSSQGIYQPLLNRHQSRLLSNIDRPRSVTGIYQPLTPSPGRGGPFIRCWSAPQGTLSQVPPQPLSSVSRQGESDPVYQIVDDEQRCPLNLDDPASVFPRSPRRSPRASPVAQRRTIHEPTYVTVHMRPSRQNRRLCNSEHEPRYTPPPCRKSSPTLHPPGSNTRRGHRRNFSDGGRALSAILNSANAESPSPPVERRPLVVLPRHLGHRRNRSDIGLCPIDRSQEHPSRRLTSASDSGIPRRPSLGSLSTEYQRSASDTTHCRVHIGP